MAEGPATAPEGPVRDIERWLLADGPALELAALVEALAHRLRALGLPLDRLNVSFGLLNPSVIAGAVVWRPNRPIAFKRYDYEDRGTGQFDRSPLKAAHQERRWIHLDLANTPDEAFGVVRELKDEGLAHYIAIPLPGSSGEVISLTIGTTDPEGFEADQLAAIEALGPALTVVVEIKRLRSTFRDVLGAYVGRSPAREIASGAVHRGQITEVRAAIMVADLRGFTYLSTRLPPAATADVINSYYDIVVPAVEAYGGEVLKFIGDAVLAIFPSAEVGDEAATLAALDASRRAFDAKPESVEAGGQRIAMRFGIAVHLGEAVYGNVGSGDRLDFTVIGRDVNIAARISTLCSMLGRDFLVSEAVAAVGRANGRAMADAGAHPVRGLEEPMPVFVPDREVVGPANDDGVSQGPIFVTSV
jgi:adenylate cyclase